MEVQALTAVAEVEAEALLKTPQLQAHLVALVVLAL
jgi:hypothetical protein